MLNSKAAALLLSATALCSVASQARAQDSEAAPEASSDTAATDEAADEIVVTGSRIQTGFRAPTPVSVLGSEEIQQRAPGAIYEVLNEMPNFRASSGPEQVQRLLTSAGAGQATSDLRGLGASRTLMLVNGRRFVSTNTAGTVNTQVIPAGLIERVEVVTGGASAAYGSDAVAGVVNFILKDRMKGVSGTVQAGISKYGDNKELGVTLSAGTSFASGRGNIAFGVDYNDNRGVGTIYERPWLRSEPGNTATPIPFTGANRPPGTPSRGFLEMVEFSAMTKGSVITGARRANGTSSTALNWTAFDESGTPFPFVRGTVYGNLMQGVTTNYGANPLSNWGLKTPNRRATAMGLIDYDLTSAVEAFFEATYAYTDIDGFSSFHTQPQVTILRNNPFLPAPIAAEMDRLGLTQIDIGRVDTEWGGAATRNTFNTYRFAGGFKWELSDSWTWDSYVQYGQTRGTHSLYHTRESNLKAAQYAIMGPDGVPVCGPIATNPNFAPGRLSAIVNPDFVLPGCAPFNPFGIGNASPESIAYVSGEQISKLNIKQTVAAANVSGDLLTLPAGPVAIAAGIEYRTESVDQRVDRLQEMGIYTNGNNKNWSGDNEVVEGYVELAVPLLRDQPLVHSLELNAAARRTYYRTSGWVTTWKVGATFEPHQAVRFRVTRSRDIRAPGIAELFSFGGTLVGANMELNPFNNQLGRIPQTNRGNPNLKPEIADTFTAGIVLQPTGFLSGLRASVDYYDIKIDGVVATVGASEVLQRCFDGREDYCAAIQFDDSEFGIRNVNTSPFNQDQQHTSGVDFEIAYRVPINSMGIPGQLNLRALGNWTRKMKRVDVPGPNAVVRDFVGYVQGGGRPKWTGTINATYQIGSLTTGLNVRLFSPIRYSPDFVGPDEEGYDPALPNSINVNRFRSIPYFSFNAAYDFQIGRAKMQVFGVVNNMFNAKAPVLSIAALNTGGNPYDYVGRTFRAGLRFQY